LHSCEYLLTQPYLTYSLLGKSAGEQYVDCDINRDFPGLYKSCLEIRDSFLVSINRYRREQGQLAVTENAGETWKGVIRAVNQLYAELAKAETEDGESGIFAQNMKEAFQKNDSGIVAFLRNSTPSRLMLSSVLCAGLKALYSAARDVGYHRNAIFSALEECPSLLQGPPDFLDIFEADENFHTKMAELYAALSKLFRTMLKWLTLYASGMCKRSPLMSTSFRK
jgi:hypothetical protein